MLPAALTALLLAPTLPAAPSKQDVVIYRHPERYACFPSLYGESDRLWVSFGWNTTRSHWGKAAGGETGGEQFFSPDGGRTWIHGHDEGYVIPPGNTSYFDLGDDVLALANGRGHEMLSPEKAEELQALGVGVKDHRNGNFTANYRAWAKRSTDDGGTWEERYLDLPPVHNLMPGFHNAANGLCDDNTMLTPQYGRLPGDEVGRAFVLRSTDRGLGWNLLTLAYDGIHTLNEASLIHVGDGRVIAHVRCEPSVPWPNSWEGGFVYQVESSDRGATWSEPERLPIWGYPQTFLRLRDGAILSSYGYRRPPYGIRACFSYDGGETWDWQNEVILRDDGLSGGAGTPKAYPGDLGYPRTVELADGSLFTVYYFSLGDGVTHIAGSRWTRDYRGPDHPRGQEAVRKPDPDVAAERIIGEERPMRFGPATMQSFVPTEPQVAMVAVRFSEKNAECEHTHGLQGVIRKIDGASWWTEWLANTDTLTPEEITAGGWTAFRFDPPLEVEPGEAYAFTLYNKDYTGGPSPELREGMTGDHAWYVNSGQPGPDDYPNGGVSPTSGVDIAFKVYGEERDLPEDP